MKAEEYSLVDFIKSYQNTATVNDELHMHFGAMTNTIAQIKGHRDYVEQNKLGFGDRAFHYMWYLVLKHLQERDNGTIRLLEIGVYKGQVISLWGQLAKDFKMEVEIHGISPLEGNDSGKTNCMKRAFALISPQARRNRTVGNLYLKEDYVKIIDELFNYFQLDRTLLTLHKGFSTDEKIVKSFPNDHFDVIYIDGDHRFEVARQDILNYSSKLKSSGLLVLDDASYFLDGGGPGKWWKGYKEVSKAAEVLPELGFRNVLNVGHNRIFAKDGSNELI